MRYLFDTNICSYMIRFEPPEILARLRQLRPNEIGLSSIVLYEMRYGAYRRGAASLSASIDRFVARFDTVDFDADSADAAARLRSSLEAEGRPIGPIDVLIAAQALNRGLILVTNNEREFKRVPGLKIENWIKRKR